MSCVLIFLQALLIVVFVLVKGKIWLNLTKKFYVTIETKLKCVEYKEFCHRSLASFIMSFLCIWQFNTSGWIQSMWQKCELHNYLRIWFAVKRISSLQIYFLTHVALLILSNFFRKKQFIFTPNINFYNGKWNEHIHQLSFKHNTTIAAIFTPLLLYILIWCSNLEQYECGLLYTLFNKLKFRTIIYTRLIMLKFCNSAAVLPNFPASSFYARLLFIKFSRPSLYLLFHITESNFLMVLLSQPT
jgi:hypothetical protein